jgi:hypothetical protein
MASIGEAIGLGNIARVDKSQPFTNVVIRKQNLDLQDRAARAKQQELDKKREEDFASMTKVKGGFLPYYQEEATNMSSSALGSIMGAPSDLQKRSIANNLTFNLDNMLAENNQLAQNLNTSRGKGLVPNKVYELFNMPKSQADIEYEKYKTTNPEIEEIVFRGQNGNLQFNPVEKVDINKVYTDASNSLKEGAIPKLDKNNNWENEKMTDNTYRFKLVADPVSLNQIAATLASDENFGKNVRYTQPKVYKAEYDRIFEEQKKLGGEIDNDNLKLAATAAVIKKDIEKRAQYNDIRNKPQPSNFNMNLGFGETPEPTDPFIANDKNSLPIVVKMKVGEEKRNISLGNTNSFKMVSILSTKPAGAIDVDKNQPVKGTVFEKVDVGDIVPVPIAQRDITDKNTGVSYKKGQMVDAKSVKGLGTEGLVLYVPMFKAIGTYKDSEKRTQTKSMFVPASGTSDAVYASQSKDDKGLTKAQIQSAMNETTQLNRTLSARFKKQATPSNIGNKGKKVAVVGADGNVTYKVQ